MSDSFGSRQQQQQQQQSHVSLYRSIRSSVTEEVEHHRDDDRRCKRPRLSSTSQSQSSFQASAQAQVKEVKRYTTRARSKTSSLPAPISNNNGNQLNDVSDEDVMWESVFCLFIFYCLAKISFKHHQFSHVQLTDSKFYIVSRNYNVVLLSFTALFCLFVCIFDTSFVESSTHLPWWIAFIRFCFNTNFVLCFIACGQLLCKPTVQFTLASFPTNTNASKTSFQFSRSSIKHRFVVVKGF